MGSGIVGEKENPTREWTDRFSVRERVTDLGSSWLELRIV